MDSDFKRALWFGLFSPTPILPMSWWWEFFENRGMMSYFNQVNKMNSKMLQAGQGEFEMFDIKDVKSELQTYGVRCGNQKFVYLHNSTGEDKIIELTTEEEINSNGKIESFDCETGESIAVNYSVLPGKQIQIQNLKLRPRMNIILMWE